MTTAQTINLFGPPVLILLALIWGGLRILYLNRTASVSVLAVLGRKRTAPEKAAGLVAILIDGYLLVRAVWPDIDRMVYGVPFSNWGVLVMAVGIGLAVLSQIEMGRSWRIGLPPEDDIESLVTGGLYQFSRNPIYVGIMIFVIGALVLVPGPLTAICVVATWYFVRQIIRDEEAYLTREFGDAYAAYTKRVRRWL